jgi:hypothetical protein
VTISQPTIFLDYHIVLPVLPYQLFFPAFLNSVGNRETVRPLNVMISFDHATPTILKQVFFSNFTIALFLCSSIPACCTATVLSLVEHEAEFRVKKEVVGLHYKVTANGVFPLLNLPGLFQCRIVLAVGCDTHWYGKFVWLPKLVPFCSCATSRSLSKAVLLNISSCRYCGFEFCTC